MKLPSAFSFFTLIGLFLVGVSGRRNALKARDPNPPKTRISPYVSSGIVGFTCRGREYKIKTIKKILMGACKKFGNFTPMTNFPDPFDGNFRPIDGIKPRFYTVKISNNLLTLNKIRIRKRGDHVVINSKCQVAGAITYGRPTPKVKSEKDNAIRIYQCEIRI